MLHVWCLFLEWVSSTTRPERDCSVWGSYYLLQALEVLLSARGHNICVGLWGHRCWVDVTQLRGYDIYLHTSRGFGAISPTPICLLQFRLLPFAYSTQFFFEIKAVIQAFEVALSTTTGGEWVLFHLCSSSGIVCLSHSYHMISHAKCAWAASVQQVPGQYQWPGYATVLKL